MINNHKKKEIDFNQQANLNVNNVAAITSSLTENI
jgi:hypothetical protein